MSYSGAGASSSSNSKTISVNPDLFRMTKKKRPPASNIKPRSAASERNKTVRRNNVLMKFIRNEQEKTYRKLLDGDINLQAAGGDTADFEDSLDYLMTLTKDENDKKQKQLQDHVDRKGSDRVENYHLDIGDSGHSNNNQTLKHRNHQLLQPFGVAPYNNIDENVSLEIPDDMMMQPMNLVRPPMPKWGCLKGGSLPSYRQYTQRNRSMMLQPTAPSKQQQLPYTTGVYHPQSVAATLGKHSGGQVHNEATNHLLQAGGAHTAANRHSEIRQTMAAAERKKPPSLPRQQRIVRRTYNVGKNKSQVSVLVSNRTIRNRVTAKTHEIRQKPMEDVKRYLIKKGFVRVGTSAPNDVLRKMYESAELICGEIQNHNPENLLFNFLSAAS